MAWVSNCILDDIAQPDADSCYLDACEVKTVIVCVRNAGVNVYPLPVNATFTNSVEPRGMTLLKQKITLATCFAFGCGLVLFAGKQFEFDSRLNYVLVVTGCLLASLIWVKLQMKAERARDKSPARDQVSNVLQFKKRGNH